MRPALLLAPALLGALVVAGLASAAPSGKTDFRCEVHVFALPIDGVATVGDCDVAIKQIKLIFPQRERSDAYSVQNGMTRTANGAIGKGYRGFAPRGSGTQTILFDLPSPLLPGEDHAHFFDAGFAPGVPLGRKVTVQLTARDGESQTVSVAVTKES